MIAVIRQSNLNVNAGCTEYGDSEIVIDDNSFVLIPGEYEPDFSFRGMR
jgi:hypothetical protein